MRRYYFEGAIDPSKEVHIQKELFHHIFDVCRLNLNSKFELISNGKAYFVQPTLIQKKDAFVKVLEERILPRPKPPYIHLCVSLPKLDTFEFILEKSVELGVYSLHPFVSQWSFVRDINHERIKNKASRWSKIVTSATQQTGRGDLMRLESLIRLEELIEKMNQTPHSMGLFCYEGESVQTIHKALENLKTQNIQNIWIFVGSEGGFSSEEVSYFQSTGLNSTTLGEQVLRVETACLSLVSIVNYEIQRILV